MPAVLVAVGLLASCTVNEAGSATPGATPTVEASSDPPTSEGAGPSTREIPPPPKDLSLDGVDPCTLFTDAQLAELEIDETRPSDGSSAGTIYEDMKSCSLDKDAAEPFVTYDVVAVTNVDVAFWINEERNADAELISIDGYPAAQFHIKGGGKYDCAIALGVAKNQHLHVEMLPVSDDVTGEAICEGTKQAAGMALRTLQTMR